MKLYDKLTSELNEALWKMSDIASDDDDSGTSGGSGGGMPQRPQKPQNSKNNKNDKDSKKNNNDNDENEDENEDENGNENEDGDGSGSGSKKGNKSNKNKKGGSGDDGEDNGEDESDDGDDGNGSKKGKKSDKNKKGGSRDDGEDDDEGEDGDGDDEGGKGKKGKKSNKKNTDGTDSDNQEQGDDKSAREKLRDYIKKGIKGGKFMHEDDKFFNPTSKDMKKAFSASYRKVRRELGPRPKSSQPGTDEGDLMDLIDSYVDSAEVDVKAILKNKLMKFAALYNQSRSQNYGAHIQSTVSRMTGGRDVGSRNKPFVVDQPESAIVLFGLDTSGSVWSQPGAIEAAAGMLNDIFNAFKTSLKTKGDVFKFMWDTNVHETSFSLWRNEKTFSAFGGGGTDPQCVFDWIDNNFAEMTVNGKTTKFQDLPKKVSIHDISKVDFVWDPKSPLLKTLGQEFQNNYRNAFRVSTKPNFELYNSIKKMTDKDIEKHINSVINKRASYLPGLDKMGKVPFLILFTDGDMNKPEIGNLYKSYPGNIFWVITKEGGLANTNPPNALYIDVEDLIEKYGKKGHRDEE